MADITQGKPIGWPEKRESKPMPGSGKLKTINI
jgi:hypothetical protein